MKAQEALNLPSGGPIASNETRHRNFERQY